MIVVTGATGHLGSHVCHLLASRGHEVVAASRSGAAPRAPWGEAPASARALAVDLTRDESVEALAGALGQGGALVHLAAWLPGATAATTAADRRRLIAVNVLGAMRAYEAARRARAAVVVFASSFEVYGNPGDLPVTEGSRVAPLTDYGASKLAGEDHLCSLTAEDGIRGVSLRFPAIYGPGERAARALPGFLRAVAGGQRPVIHGDGGDLRDQIHVRDAAQAVERAIESGGSGIFNVADGEAHSILELARVAMEAGGIEGEPLFLPRQKPRLDFHMSIALASGRLGFSPRVALADGAREQLGWLRAGGLSG